MILLGDWSIPAGFTLVFAANHEPLLPGSKAHLLREPAMFDLALEEAPEA